MFDPNLPAANSPNSSAQMRAQLNGLKDLIDAVPAITHGVVDEVTTLPPEQPAAVNLSFVAGVLHFSFAIPQGVAGAMGETGPTGSDGLNGSDGADGQPGEVTLGQLGDAIAGTSANSNSVETLGLGVSDPPTQAEMQALTDKVNELITALRR